MNTNLRLEHLPVEEVDRLLIESYDVIRNAHLCMNEGEYVKPSEFVAMQHRVADMYHKLLTEIDGGI